MALSHLSASISLSQTYGFDLLLKLALLRSARQQLLMGHAKKALKMIDEVGPQIDKQGSLLDRGYCKYLHSLCTLSQKEPNFLIAKLYLQEAILYYEKMSASSYLEDCWLLKAQIDTFLDDSAGKEAAFKMVCQAKHKKVDLETFAELLEL